MNIKEKENKIVLDDCFNYLLEIPSNYIDLILIDPPYLISRATNFKSSQNLTNDYKTNFSKISYDFGDWDKKELNWDFLFKEFKRILKKGGTLLIFYDGFKMQELYNMGNKYKFKQPRLNIWQKTNPMPVNSNINYLSNSREYFITFVKGSKPTFNSKFDNGLYLYPSCCGKERTAHPTQKNSKLIEDLIKKHSNKGDKVLDCFSGSGTTAVSCYLLDRIFFCCEIDKTFFDLSVNRLNEIKQIYKEI